MLSAVCFLFIHFHWLSLLDPGICESGSCPAGFDGWCSQGTALFPSFKDVAQRKRPVILRVERDYLQSCALKIEIKELGVCETWVINNVAKQFHQTWRFLWKLWYFLRLSQSCLNVLYHFMVDL